MPRGQARNVTETRRGRKGGVNKDDDLSPPPQKKAKAVGSSKVVQKGRRKNQGVVLSEDETTEKVLDKETIQNEAFPKKEDVKDNVRASRKRKVQKKATEVVEIKIVEDKNVTSKGAPAKKGRSESSSEKEDASKETESKTKKKSKKEEKKEEVSVRKTRHTRLSESFSSDVEKEMEKRSPIDIQTSSELKKQENKNKNKSIKEVENYSSDAEKKSGQQLVSGELGTHEVKITRQTRNTRKASNLSLDRDNDLKQQDTTDTSTDTEMLPEDEKHVSKTRYTRRTESLSSDGERDIKQQNATELSSDNDVVQRKATGTRVTRYTRRTESLSSDGEKDLKQQKLTDKKPVQQKLKVAHRTRNTRQTESSSSDAERDINQQNAVEPFVGSIPIPVEKRVHKTRNMRTESLSSERETSVEQQQNITPTVEQEKKGVKYTRETRSSRRSGSYSSDKEKDIQQSLKTKTAVPSESCSYDVDNVNKHAVDSELEKIVVVSNTNIKPLNDIEKENVSNEKDEKTKSSSRTRRARRIEDSCSDQDNEKRETTTNLSCELEVVLNKDGNDEKKDSENETSFHETAQSKQGSSNSDVENLKNEQASLSSDENIKILNDVEIDVEQELKNKKQDNLKTRNKGRNIKGSRVQAVHNLSDEEHKKSRKTITAGHKTRDVIKSTVNTQSYPDIQDNGDLSNLEVVDNVKEKTVKRGRRKTKNLNKVELEIDMEDKGNKECNNKVTIEEIKKDSDASLVNTSNLKKAKIKVYQHDKKKEEIKTERKTRNANKKETLMIESNEELVLGDLDNNTHKSAASKKLSVAKASKSSEGSDLDSSTADDIIDNRMDVTDSSSTTTVETLIESETTPINCGDGIVLEDTLRNTFEVPNEAVEDPEPRGKFPLFTRGRRRRGRVAKVQGRGKMSTRSLKKFPPDVSSETNHTAEVEHVEDGDHLKEIVDISVDSFKNNIQMCKKVSVVIKRLDLNDPQIYKLISDSDLDVLKSGKENCEQHVKSINTAIEIAVDEFCDKPDEPCEAANEVEMIEGQETNYVAAVENKEQEEQINVTMGLPNESTKESVEVTNPKDAQLLSSSDVDSFNPNEITFENAAEKESFESIVERYVSENVNIGIDDPENADYLTSELNCINSLALEKFDEFEENSKTDNNTAYDKNNELKMSYTENQESGNTEIDASENFSESNLSANLDLETLIDKSNSLENLSPVFFSNLDFQEPKVITIVNQPEIGDSKLVVEDETCVNEGLEVEDNKESEGEAEIEFANVEKSHESKDAANSNIHLKSTCAYGDKTAVSVTEKKNMLRSKATAKNTKEIEENANSGKYDENNEKCFDINSLDGKVMEKYPENLKISSIEESLVENKSNKNGNSGTLEDPPNELLNIKDHLVMLEASKLAEISNKSDQCMAKNKQIDQTVLQMLEKVDSDLNVSSIANGRSMDADDITVEMDLDLAEDENTDISVEVSTVDVNKICSEKEDMKSPEMSQVCVDDFASKSNVEVTFESMGVSKSFTISKSLPEGNLEGADSESSGLNDSDAVLKELNERIDDKSDQVNETLMSCDGTNELQTDVNTPSIVTEEIETIKAKEDLFPKRAQTEIKSIKPKGTDRNVKDFVNSTKDGNLLGSVKHSREKELSFDGITAQIGSGSDSLTNRLDEKKIQVMGTSNVNTILVTNNQKTNAGFPEMGSETKNNAGFSKMHPSADYSQPGPSSASSHPKKSSEKHKRTEVQLTSVGHSPRWPRMLYTPVRLYLEQFVPLLLEGLLCVTSVRPSDPVQFLASWMETNKADAYFRMKQNPPKRSKGPINNSTDGKKPGR